MSIYLAQFTPKESHNPLFAQRGLAFMTSASLNTIDTFGICHRRGIAFDGYRSNIDIFVGATNRQMKLSTSAPGCYLSNHTRALLPIAHPRVAFKTQAKMNDDQYTVLLQKLKAYEPEKRTAGKSVIIVIHKPTAALYPKLVAIASEQVVHAEGCINLHAYGSFLHLLRIASEYCCVDTYPTNYLMDDGSGDMSEEGRFVRFEQHQALSLKKKEKGESDDNSSMMPGEGDLAMAEDAEVHLTEEELILKDFDIIFGPAETAVFHAKPSPIPLDFNYGPVSSVPTFAGRCFPYFPRMILPSNKYLIDQLATTFFRTLGDSRVEQLKAFKSIKSGILSLTSCAEAQVLAHIFKGIELSLQTQTRLYVVIDNGYAGFVLLGSRFSIYDGKDWHEAQNSDDLAFTVASMSTHAAAIRDICAVLSRVGIDGEPASEPSPVDPKSVTSGMSLLQLCVARKPTAREDIDELSRLLSKVAFPIPYKNVTVESLTWALEMMTTKCDVPLDSSLPAFVVPSLRNLGDRVYQVLSVFGPDVPSFWNASGSKYAIPSPTTKLDENEKESELTGEKGLPKLRVAHKSILTGYQDMKKVLKDRMVQMDLKERAGASRCVEFKGDARDRLYAKLKECVHYGGSVTAPVKGKGKRVLDDDEVETDFRSVKAKTAEDVLDMDF